MGVKRNTQLKGQYRYPNIYKKVPMVVGHSLRAEFQIQSGIGTERKQVGMSDCELDKSTFVY